MVKRVPLPICIILILGLFLQLGLSAALNDLYNIANMRTFASLALKGNPFRLALGQSTEFGPIDWPYPPFCLVFLLPPTLIYQATGSELLFQLTFKFPLILANLITAALIYLMAQRTGSTRRFAHSIAALFLFNPAVLLSSSVGGWESLSITFFVASYWLLTCENRLDLSAIMLGVAIAIRGYPILLLPLFSTYVWSQEGHKEGIRFAFLALMPAAVSITPFIIANASAFWQIIGPEQTTFGPLSTFLPVSIILGRLGVKSKIVAAIFIAILVWRLLVLYVRYAKKGSYLIGASLFAFLLLLFYYPKVHWAYPLLALPFALLSKNRWAQLAWLPGLLWALLLNGKGGATGLFYWTAWRTDLYVTTWQYLGLKSHFLLPLTIGFITIQALLLVWAMREASLNKAC